MQIIPINSIDSLIGVLGSMITANVIPILAILFFGIVVIFVIRWFNRGNKMLTGDKGFFNGQTGKWEKW